MNRNKLPLKSWSIKASCFHYLAYCGIMCSATAATHADICEIRVLVFFPQQCDGVINVFISEPNQTKCRPIWRWSLDETLIFFALSYSQTLIFFILLITVVLWLILGFLLTWIQCTMLLATMPNMLAMIKCRWGVKWRLRLKNLFFILHNSSVHMKANAACIMLRLRIVCFF